MLQGAAKKKKRLANSRPINHPKPMILLIDLDYPEFPDIDEMGHIAG